jgi:hypothetical protein
MTTRTSRTTTAALALLLGLTLSACGDDGSDPAPQQAEATQAPGDSGGTYASTGELYTALNDAGLPCEEPLEGEYPGVTEAKGCILDGSEDVVLLRFGAEAEKQEYLAQKEELASVVVGENWAVQTVLPETAERVAEVLGGEVVRATG